VSVEIGIDLAYQNLAGKGSVSHDGAKPESKQDHTISRSQASESGLNISESETSIETVAKSWDRSVA